MQELHDPQVEASVTGYFATLSARDKKAWMSLFASGAVVHEPVGTTPAEGREGLEEVWQVFTGPFERLAIQCDEVFYAASGAAAVWSARASASDGRTADFRGVTVFETDDEGRIQTAMGYWDPAAVLIRLADDAG